jgi:hypothetical protein
MPSKMRCDDEVTFSGALGRAVQGDSGESDRRGGVLVKAKRPRQGRGVRGQAPAKAFVQGIHKPARKVVDQPIKSAPDPTQARHPVT